MTNHDVNAIQALVLEFVRDMNSWERAFYKEWRQRLEGFDVSTPEDQRKSFQVDDENFTSNHQAIYASVFRRFCTQRKRSFGGPDIPRSAGMPTKYEGLDERTLLGVELKRPGRAEVTFQADGKVIDYKFLFVVLKASGEWRIDGYKYQFHGEAKWNIGNL